MSVTYEGIQSASIQDAPLAIPKPTGLALGDLMVAGIYWSDDNSGSGSIVPPTGWDLFQAKSLGSPVHERLEVFTKIADSDDLAASSFTFSHSGGSTYHFIGHIIRVSEFGIVAGTTSNTDINLTNTITAMGFIPTRENTLFIAFLGDSLSNTAPTATSVALSTDNPTWTERADTSFNDGSMDSNLAVYTAVRTQATDTGTITGTFSGNTAQKMIVVLALSSQTNSAVTPTTKMNAYSYSPVPIDIGAVANSSAPDVSVRYPTRWIKETKPGITWVSETSP